MKKLIVLSLSAFLLAGTAFASDHKDHKHDGKKCAKAKECKKDGKDCCSGKESKDAKKTAPVKDTKKTDKKTVKS